MPRLSRELSAGLDDSVAYNDEAHNRLEREREAVLQCLDAEAASADPAARAAACGPALTDPAHAVPPPQVFWDAVAGGRVAAHNDSEARHGGQAARHLRLDGLVALDPHVLRHNKWLLEQGHAETQTAVNGLLEEARGLLDLPLDIISDKPLTPPDGDKRSYVSLAPGCWPANPADLQNPQGPWTCDADRPFPDAAVIAPDYDKLVRTQRSAFTLALAWWFSRDERYALRAAAVIRAFFLDPQTGMNPHLRFAALDPSAPDAARDTLGSADNEGIGLVFDAAAILSESVFWIPEDSTRLAKWASEYVLYLQSRHCQRAQAAPDARGTLFDVQYLAVLQFLGRNETVLEYLDAAATPRLRGQIHGSVVAAALGQPQSFSLENAALQAFVRLAMQAERLLVDLWRVGADTGNSLLDAWDWMSEHWCDRGESMWPRDDVGAVDLGPPAQMAGAVYTAAARRAPELDSYTLRTHSYALSWHALRAGPDPDNSLEWASAVARQLTQVRFNDCFITTCPERPVLPEDPPTYPAFCLPAAAEPMPYLDGLRGRWADAAQSTADIRRALTQGDPRPPPPPRLPLRRPQPAAAAAPGGAAAPSDAVLDSADLDTEDGGAQHSAEGVDYRVDEEEEEDDEEEEDEEEEEEEEEEVEEVEEVDARRQGRAHVGARAGAQHAAARQSVQLEHGADVKANVKAVPATVAGGLSGGWRLALETQDGGGSPWLISAPGVFGLFGVLVVLLACGVRYRVRVRGRKVA